MTDSKEDIIIIKVCKIISELLVNNNKEVTPDADIFDLGFSSLTVLVLLDQIEIEYGIHIAVNDSFIEPNPISISRLIRKYLPQDYGR